MDELVGSGDPDVDAFVGVNINSFAAWDVAVYLEHNAGTAVDLVELSGRLGRKESELEDVLHHFVGNGVVLASAGADGIARYGLTCDPGVRRNLTRFVELAKVRELRLEFVRRVLSGMPRG